MAYVHLTFFSISVCIIWWTGTWHDLFHQERTLVVIFTFNLKEPLLDLFLNSRIKLSLPVVKFKFLICEAFQCFGRRYKPSVFIRIVGWWAKVVIDWFWDVFEVYVNGVVVGRAGGVDEGEGGVFLGFTVCFVIRKGGSKRTLSVNRNL